MKRLSWAVVCVGLLASAVASAEPRTADEWYKEGDDQYNLRDFAKAVDAFKKGFELETNNEKKPAYLYNIAQAYRQAGDCENALFFYKRFLGLRADDTARPLKPEIKADIDKKIAGMQDALAHPGRPVDDAHPERCTPQVTGTAPTTGTGTTGTGAPTSGTGTTGSGTTPGVETGLGVEAGPGESASAPFAPPKLITMRIMAGVAKLDAGDLTTPVRFTGTLIGGYPLRLGDKLTLELGAAIAYQPTNYDDNADKSHSSSFFSILANAGVLYAVAPKIGIRADVGVGDLVFTGLEMGNPFTQGGVASSGAVSMLAVRVGVSADYLITPNVFATVAPITFSYSPAKSGMVSDISSINRFDFMVGVGYRM